MSILSIRFRSEGALVVLQVSELENTQYGSYQREPKWRDAKVEDLIEAARFIGDPQRLNERIQTLKQRAFPVNSSAEFA